MKEYVVTLKNKEDLDSFYEDMETPGGNLYIPSRAVPVYLRRTISRNTHYLLTDEEAATIKNDPRVLNVELSMEERGLEFRPQWTVTSSLWNKSNTISQFHQHWALLRCTEGVQRSNWGSNGTTNVNATAYGTLTGKNVDVVIVDGLINPDHPEFAVNIDGTGGSRVIQYNWFQLTSALGLGSNSTYVYTPYVDPTYPDNDADGISDRTDDNDHGCHVAGTVAGNSYGWARDANIYNISPYSSAPSTTSYFIDYIRQWHRSKSINPATGRRNPTITNHSYGVTYGISISSITSVRYQGTIYTGPFTSTQLNNYGITTSGTNALIPARVSYLEADIQEAVAEGVIFVGAAGNSGTKIDNYSADTSADYNNYASVGGSQYFYMRGSIGSSDNMICVGAISSLVNETKATFSCCGPRIDVYAPGAAIISSVNSDLGTTSNDYRDVNYKIKKYQGTSMASPQVCGVLACVLETWPSMTQEHATTYIHRTSKLNQLTDTAGGPTDNTSLQGSVNRHLYYYPERPVNGAVGPKLNFGNRPSTGQTWPRTKIFRYGT